jgi:hypothetical protein
VKCGGVILYTVSYNGRVRCVVWNPKNNTAKLWDAGYVTPSDADDFVSWKTNRTNKGNNLFTSTYYDDVVPYKFMPQRLHWNYLYGSSRWERSIRCDSPLTIANQKPGFLTTYENDSYNGESSYTVYVRITVVQSWVIWSNVYHQYITTTQTYTESFYSYTNEVPTSEARQSLIDSVRAGYPPNEFIPYVSAYDCSVGEGMGWIESTQNSVSQYYDPLGFVCEVPISLSVEGAYGSSDTSYHNQIGIERNAQIYGPPNSEEMINARNQYGFAYNFIGSYTDSIITQVTVVQYRRLNYTQLGSPNEVAVERDFYVTQEEWDHSDHAVVHSVHIPYSTSYVMEDRVIVVKAMAHYDENKGIEDSSFDWSRDTSRNSTLAGLLEDAILAVLEGEDEVKDVSVAIEIY